MAVSSSRECVRFYMPSYHSGNKYKLVSIFLTLINQLNKKKKKILQIQASYLKQCSQTKLKTLFPQFFFLKTLILGEINLIVRPTTPYIFCGYQFKLQFWPPKIFLTDCLTISISTISPYLRFKPPSTSSIPPIFNKGLLSQGTFKWLKSTLNLQYMTP